MVNTQILAGAANCDDDFELTACVNHRGRWQVRSYVFGTLRCRKCDNVGYLPGRFDIFAMHDNLICVPSTPTDNVSQPHGSIFQMGTAPINVLSCYLTYELCDIHTTYELCDILMINYFESASKIR